jgi:fructan beta-fructosidase
LIFDFKIELDYKNPQYYVYVNVERFKDMNIDFTCEPYTGISIDKADVKPKESKDDPFRPIFHYTAGRGWLNDPNGLVFYNGLYHMFYQYNPFGCKWANIHWGHAVSKDLVHWDELDCALYPDEFGYNYSGSAIVDKSNATGLKKNENDVILIYYTAAGGDSELSEGRHYTQCIAYSDDGGRRFKKYDRNPVVPYIAGKNRDPKVVFDAVYSKYILCLYLEGEKYALFSSDDLISWNKFQEIILDGDDECPDFYPLKDEAGKSKWVFCGASDRYKIGEFDGCSFMSQTETMRLSYGSHSYAAQSWSDIDPKDGRRIRIAWNKFSMPQNMLFNCSMTFPCEMSLKTFGGNSFLCAYPVGEIKKLYEGTKAERHIHINKEKAYSMKLDGMAYDLTMSFEDAENAEFTISFLGVDIICSTIAHELKCLGDTAPLECFNCRVNLRILVDTTGVEIYINYGKCTLIHGLLIDPNLNTFTIEADSGEFLLDKLELSKIG